MKSTETTETTEFETLRFKVKEGVAWLRLNRPDRLNAFTPEMWAEMRTLGRELLADPGDVRVLVVSGEGRAFSSGSTRRSSRADSASPTSTTTRPLATRTRR